jgi:hypothetical protein
MESDISFEQITDVFWYGIHGEFRLVINKDIGYANASQMCADGGKDFSEWLHLKLSQKLIIDLSRKLFEESTAKICFTDADVGTVMNIVYIDPLICVTTPKVSEKLAEVINLFEELIDEELHEVCYEDSEIMSNCTGVYIHPKLVPSVARWVSPTSCLPKACRIVQACINQK